MAMSLAANTGGLYRAYATPVRTRWDYFTGDHSMSDMANADYFRSASGLLTPGDIIHIIDRDEEETVVRVQYVDLELNEVGIAIAANLSYQPADGDYQIRHAGGRGRGTRWQIVDPQGKVVQDNIAGKQTAERELEELRRVAA